MHVCVRVLGRESAGGGGVWKIPSGDSQSAGEEIEAEKKKVVHKKLAVYLKKGRCLTNINVKAGEEEIKPII